MTRIVFDSGKRLDFNPNHGANGQFASKSGGGGSGEISRVEASKRFAGNVKQAPKKQETTRKTSGSMYSNGRIIDIGSDIEFVGTSGKTGSGKLIALETTRDGRRHAIIKTKSGELSVAPSDVYGTSTIYTKRGF